MEQRRTDEHESAHRQALRVVADGKGGYLTAEEYRMKRRLSERWAAMPTKKVTHVGVGPAAGQGRWNGRC